jgi:hypothetical protein
MPQTHDSVGEYESRSVPLSSSSWQKAPQIALKWRPAPDSPLRCFEPLKASAPAGTKELARREENLDVSRQNQQLF